MNPINVNPSDLCGNCAITGFTPLVHYAFALSALTLTMYDNSTVPAGAALKIAKYRVNDQFGNEKRGSTTIKGSGHTAVIDVSGLNLSKGISIEATVIVNNGMAADGNIVLQTAAADAAGNITDYDIQMEAAQP